MKKTRNKPPSIWLLLALLLFIGIGTCIFAEKPAQEQIERQYATELWLVGGNSVKAIVPPAELKPTPLTSLIDDIVECESNWRQDAVGKAGEIGVAQFMPKTWEWMSKISGIKGDLYDTNDQIRMLRWALKNNYEYHWTCFDIVR